MRFQQAEEVEEEKRGGRGNGSGIGSSSGGSCGRQNFIRELDDWEKELKINDNYVSKEDIPLSILKKRRKLKEDDNSEEIISSYTTKITSADVMSIKYKIEPLTKYQ
ncbi:hypothetical protein Glove_410g118 [Diversispora epigaea]|uniref:Uncharacterized protein n=1 Tax=Diversispora epigaea TaxID=1348612 RepID=A0A397GYW0_9GLOM|nr:hypothetical protein Glove_410g118 [Diversispora epigaea]